MTLMMSRKIRVAITMGDPSGIGPAIIAKALPELAQASAELVIIGDKWVLDKPAGKIKAEVVDLKNVSRAGFKFGRIRPEYGRASVEYLDTALDLIKAGQADCLVTCPISKEAVSRAGFAYPGHTEYLAAAAGVRDYAMFLLSGRMRFSLVTRHIPFEQVPSSLTIAKICQNIRLAHESLRTMFSIKHPRIAACALNPHASDNGLLGSQENKVIKPALKRARDAWGIRVDGPLSADVAVYQASGGRYDCLIAMYHDQAMIPLKLCGYRGVNMTLGLPYVRTSPLHGTAFDIAAKPHLACPDSLVAAVQTAVQCAQNLRKG